MFTVFIIVLSFESSANLASAYGIAVTGTMIITTVLSFIVIRATWHWNFVSSYSFLIIFFIIDFIFLSSNSLKIVSGGWLPLAVGGFLFLLMMTWIRGRAMLSDALESKKVLFEELEEHVATKKLVTVEGTAIYLTRSLHGIPPVLFNNLQHNHVIHEKVVVLTLVTIEEPYIDDEEKRVKIRTFGTNNQFYRVKLYFGFKETPDIPSALRLAIKKGLKINEEDVSFFVGNEHITFKKSNKMPVWRRNIFLFLFKNAGSAVDFFKIPVDKVIELCIRVEL
jgi:KUP system potassium uptake protein